MQNFRRNVCNSLIRKIATYLGYSNHISLSTYIKKRKIKDIIPKNPPKNLPPEIENDYVKS